MIIQNILPDFLKKNIYEELMGSFFSWYWNDNINYGDLDENLFQFTHTFFKDNAIVSEKINLVLPIIWFFQDKTNIKIKSIYRIKANLNVRYNMNKKDKEYSIHKDNESDNFLSLIYYVNDSDGDTLIYDNNKNIIEKIKPISNNLYYFKSNTFHSATFPKVNKKRIIINFILEIEPN